MMSTSKNKDCAGVEGSLEMSGEDNHTMQARQPTEKQVGVREILKTCSTGSSRRSPLIFGQVGVPAWLCHVICWLSSAS